MKEYALLGVYSDICHRHFMPHRAINYIIERFGYFLVFHSSNYHSIYYRTDQKVTKTLNNVIDSSMKHKMSMAYARIYTQQSIFFHKVSSDHQNDNFEAFSRLSMLLIADKTNTNSCQAWIFTTLNFADSRQNKYQFLSSLDFGQFHKCGSCSLKHTISSNCLVLFDRRDP